MRLALLAAAALAFPASASAHRHHHHRPVAWPALPSDPWPHWGNDTIGDCSFAAAADWLIMQGARPTEAQLVQDFHAAGGSDTEGLTATALSAYWSTTGIAGVRASLTPTGQVARGTIAMIRLYVGEQLQPLPFRSAGMTVIPGAMTIEAAGLHFVLVTAVTGAGPQVVTWGRVIQLTWAQWTTTALEMFQPTRRSP